MVPALLRPFYKYWIILSYKEKNSLHFFTALLIKSPNEFLLNHSDIFLHYYDKYLERNQIKEMSFSNVTLYQTMKSNKMFQIIPNSIARVTLNCTKGTNFQLEHLELINLSVFSTSNLVKTMIRWDQKYSIYLK